MSLLKKEILIIDNQEYTMELFKDRNRFNIITKIPKEISFKNNNTFKEFIKNIDKLFEGIEVDYLYIPHEYELSETEFFLDVYYNKDYMISGDEDYLTGDDEVGKNIISVELISENEKEYKFEINLASLKIKNEKEYIPLWEFSNNVVSNFLKSEITFCIE